MTSLKVKIKGVDKMATLFAKAPAITKAELNPAIKKAITRLLAGAIPNIPVDTGFLLNRNNQSFGDLTGTLENLAPYAAAVHDGSDPHFPPIDAVTPWATRKGIPPFLVAKAISERGTKGKKFYEIAIKDTESELEGYFEAALKSIVNQLSK